MKKNIFVAACCATLLFSCSQEEEAKTIEESVSTDLMHELESANENSEAVMELNEDLDLFIDELNN